jgi:hypothetical protein
MRRNSERALAHCAAQLIPAGSRRFIGDLEQTEALIVEEGFLVVRFSSRSARQVVVAEAGAGSFLLAPSDREHLHALTNCSVTMLPLGPLEDLMAIPTVARTLFRGLGSSLRLRQDAASYFANVRHIDRVYEEARAAGAALWKSQTRWYSA